MTGIDTIVKYIQENYGATVFLTVLGYSNYHINQPDNHNKYSEEGRVAFNNALKEYAGKNNCGIIHLDEYVDNVNWFCVEFSWPEILKFLAPEKYWAGICIIPPIVFATYIQFIYAFYVNIEHYHKTTKSIANNTVIAAILNIILNLQQQLEVTLF